METKRPEIGVGILIVREIDILLGMRRSSHGAGEYAAPGGHLELGESIADCVLRELDEEVGPQLEIQNLRQLCFTNMRRYLPKHYGDIGVVAEWKAGEPLVMEPHKLESWGWYPMNNLPEPLFGCMRNYLQAYNGGPVFYED